MLLILATSKMADNDLPYYTILRSTWII